MKITIAFVVLLFSSIANSQSVVGKWKPVFISLDVIARADIKADTVFISKVVKENVKDDKDPEISEQMIRFAINAMVKKAKESQEEYFEDGKYNESNTRTGRKKTGTYIYNKTANTLERTVSPLDNKESFTVSWKNGQLILTTEMESSNGKKGKLEIVYEKL